MINEKMYLLGSKRSIIREIFEYGRKRKFEVGENKVYDFSLGNPNVLPPKEVNEAIIEALKNDLIHGYTSAPGDVDVRRNIARGLNERFNTAYNFNNLYITMGAAASLCATLRGILNEGDEVIVFAPFFTEYTVFVESNGGHIVVVSADLDNFQVNFSELSKLININTKAVIINSPNNPSGVVYTENTIKQLTSFLSDKQEEYKHDIYLISDEPYREIAFDIEVPFIPNYYDNTIVCYSYSKSLSLPGERIGYVLVPDELTDSKTVYAAICGAGRALGYVCAPSLFQYVIGKCCDMTSDIEIYERNRDIIYNGLTELGYECVKPNGAFYLFVKALEEDANKFYKKALEYDILVVPSDDFGVTGYVRLAYCVKTETLINSLPAFKKLKEEYNK